MDAAFMRDVRETATRMVRQFTTAEAAAWKAQERARDCVVGSEGRAFWTAVLDHFRDSGVVSMDATDEASRVA